MSYRRFKRNSIIAFILMVILKFLVTAFFIYILIYSVTRINTSLKENNTTFFREVGKEFSLIQKEFNSGLNE